MGKLLLLVVAAVVLFFVLKGLRKPKAGEGGAGGVRRDGERMVHCGHCGLYLPESEAKLDAGRYFCSEEHRRLFAG